MVTPSNDESGSGGSPTNAIPTIDVVNADADDGQSSGPPAHIHVETPAEGEGADGRDAGASPLAVPRIAMADAPTPALAPQHTGASAAQAPHGILLDVPSTRARSGSASGSVSFSLSRSPSPSPSRGDDSSFLTTPPSPTLSTRSTPSSTGHYPTSLALRDNRPDAQAGLSSLTLLHPNSPSHGHMRKGSFASTFAGSDGGEPSSPTSPAIEPPDSARLSVGQGHGPSIDGYQSHSRRTSITIAAPSSPGGGGSCGDADASSSGKHGSWPENDEPGAEADMGPFPAQLSALALARLVDPKSLHALEALGGVDGLLHGLGTDARRGLSNQQSAKRAEPARAKGRKGSGDGAPPAFSSAESGAHATHADRQRVYGQNVLPARASKSLLLLMWLALKDKDFGTQRPTFSCGNGQTCTQPPVDWVEGVAIMVAIVIVVVVGSMNDWQKRSIINVKSETLRYWSRAKVVPCDGVFLTGHNVKCDESGMTGESDAIKKAPYADCKKGETDGSLSSHTDCFVVSGSKVLEGVGSYVVIAVGVKSFNGRIMMAPQGLLLFVALLIRFFVQLGTGEPVRSANQKGLAFVQILIISVTLIVVAVPEGLPLAVTLALAFATKRMTQENLLVRVLGSCETMANASVVCTDKTGTLTQNAMSVVAGSVGIRAKFVLRLAENQARTNVGEEPGVRETPEEREQRRRHPDDFSIDQSELNDVLSPALRRLFNDALAVNSTAFEDEDSKTGARTFVGSKTETALLRFAQELGWADYGKTRASADVVQMLPFSSERKAMGVVVKRANGRWRLYLKGASEILTKKCTRHVVVARPGEDVKDAEEDDNVETKEIDLVAKDNISRTIIFYANQTLRTIAVCYRDLDEWPPAGSADADEVPYEELATDLTLIAITGIEDPYARAVKMCTGDNVLTARSIALQCGIFTPGGIIMEGPVFRDLNDRDMLEVVPRLQVLARSSPEDKKILVEKLKELGEIVGVTGDGTNDGPALKTAHVGFSMGVAGTEVAKEASDIILMDDNFASIVKAIMWGRCVNDAVRKFLQFQVSVNITAVIITFVTAVASSQEESALSAVQLLWINIIMDTFAALALATDPASPALLDRKPDKKTAPLFNVDMYKQIFGQSVYQTIVILVFHFAGNAIFDYRPDPNNESVQLDNTTRLNTLVFNAFVFMQIFNSINSRRIDSKKNIFEGIMRNYYFIVITLLEIGVQILIVFVGGSAFQVSPIIGRDWGISVALGFMSIPIGYLIRLIPNPPVERLFIKLRLLRDPSVLPTERPNVEEGEWNPAINLLRDNLTTFSNLRGGRARASSFVAKSRSTRLEEAGVRLPSIMTMLPTIVATSVGAGWAPQRDGSLSDPASSDPSRSSAALWEGKLQLHPETTKDDPAYKKWGGNASLAPPADGDAV
ncbi:calcium-translocating P-type ATPase [Phellopilus nigrolimitatus]|nr:calcium-translocating P-type ATPase [Phellopilus nigrolimitatus]